MTNPNIRRNAPILPSPDFIRFYEHYHARIYRYLRYQTYDPYLAEELAAEVFTRAYEGRDGFRGKTNPEACGWLWVIARNNLHAFRRKRAAERLALERVDRARLDSTEDTHPIVSTRWTRRA